MHHNAHKLTWQADHKSFYHEYLLVKVDIHHHSVGKLKIVLGEKFTERAVNRCDRVGRFNRKRFYKCVIGGKAYDLRSASADVNTDGDQNTISFRRLYIIYKEILTYLCKKIKFTFNKLCDIIIMFDKSE